MIAALLAPEIEQPERREVPALTMMLAEAQVPEHYCKCRVLASPGWRPRHVCSSILRE